MTELIIDSKMLHNLFDLVEIGESGLEQLKKLRSTLMQSGVSEVKIRKVIQKASEKHLLSLQKYVSWGDENNANIMESLLRRIPGVNLDEISRRRDIGSAIYTETKDFELFLRKETNCDLIRCRHAELIQKYPFLESRLSKAVKYALNRKYVSERNRRLHLAGKSLSSVHAGEVRAIGALKPCEAWDLLIDESGSEYGSQPSEISAGKIVGILVPTSTDLPDLPDFHAVSETPERVDQVLQELIGREIGIFGISVRDIPHSKGERWMDGVCEVIHWVWQQLPLDSAKAETRLNVFIENRGEFDASADLRALKREFLRHWASVDPMRPVALSLQVVGKDGHKHLGYADAVAFTWGSPSRESKARLVQSRLSGPCLQEIGSGMKLRNLRDFFARPEMVDGENWKWLTSLSDSSISHSLSGLVLSKLAGCCRTNAAKWDELVESLFNHLESKALDLQILARQCQWLENCRPQASRLPKTATLMLRVAQLATKNHLGETDCEPLLREVTRLGDELLLEDAHLVCRADLHLAVQPTNSFQFGLAWSYMRRWRKILGLDEEGNEVPLARPDTGVMVLGLKLSGRVKSTLGQHLSFQGRNAQACALFQRALQDFARLSDKRSAAMDATQTGIYLAIASMDDPDCAPELVRHRVEKVLGPLDQAVNRLAGNVDAGQKYSHHLLLRYLAQSGDEGLTSRYLDAAGDMAHDFGHPWQLIQFYRVYLARRHARHVSAETLGSIWDLAFDTQQGPTVRFIGLVMGAALGGIDPSWDIVPKTLGDLRTTLPGADGRLDTLRRYLGTAPADALDVMRELLPFNFR